MIIFPERKRKVTLSAVRPERAIQIAGRSVHAGSVGHGSPGACIINLSHSISVRCTCVCGTRQDHCWRRTENTPGVRPVVLGRHGLVALYQPSRTYLHDACLTGQVVHSIDRSIYPPNTRWPLIKHKVAEICYLCAGEW